MNARRKVTALSLLAVALLVGAACSSAAPPPSFQPEPGDAAGVPAPAALPEAMPTAAPAGVEVASSDKSALGGVAPSPYRAGRMIIKNGEMSLRVADTNRAIDQVTGFAVDSGGYIVSSRTWEQDGFKYATLTMGVPSDQFEAVQRRLRTIAVSVLSDTASGQDVSDEYVDLQSRLVNLEATAARIREFLNQAKTVEEALKVNAQLSEVEGEIEQVKGRMNYLKDRSAYSTLTVNLEPQHPTPTPTPTSTPTPTPTPVVWNPGETFKEAGGALSGLLRGLGDVLIWLGVVVAPFAVPFLVIWAIWRRSRRAKSVPQVDVKRDA